MSSNKNEVFEYLIDQLRQQVNSNQCEDLAQEVQSLKNQLRDASSQIKELNRELSVLANAFPHEPEQSGCRKGDAQGCAHNWIIAPGLFIAEGHKDNVPGSRFCCECGAREWDDDGYKPKADTQEWPYRFYYVVTDGSAPFGTKVCKTCGGYF